MTRAALRRDALLGVAASMVVGYHVQLPGRHPATLGLDASFLVFGRWESTRG